MSAIFTIGHSNLEIEKFIENLKSNNIDVLVDVRTSPYSRFQAVYNQESIKKHLESAGIKYLFLGKELGARTSDSSCYINGRVSYDLLSKTDLFKVGMDRLDTGISKYNVCLMCAEQDPIDCHRMVLITRRVRSEVDVYHILKNGTAESQKDSVKRLREKFKIESPEFIRSEEELTNLAYDLQGDKISYMEEGLK